MEGADEEQVYRFIFEKIDSVPQLEALLLLWNERPRQRSERELMARLFIGADALRDIMRSLVQNQFVALETVNDETRYAYKPASKEMDELIGAVAATYRKELVRVSKAIHSKAASGAREFGRAFKFKKGTD